MRFHTAYLKLTLCYVLIVMAISVIFSVSLFRISTNELGNNFGRQSRILRDVQLNSGAPLPMMNFEDARQQAIDESSDHLRNNLIYFNLLILILASCASYFLARMTLRPIEEAMEAQNRFSADASHELRTPLAAMRSEIEVFLRDIKFDSVGAKKLLKSNLEEIEKLEILSGALLKLARMEKNSKKDFNSISLEDTIVEAYEKVEKLAVAKQIEFENDLLEVKIKGDKHSLVELIAIFLENAIKYSPEKSKIFITLKDSKDYAIVKIKDQGVGIKASDLPFIFNRFYRADFSRSKEKINGYGLGLSIAKEIIDLHGGKISTTSTPDKGSEFTIKLPK